MITAATPSQGWIIGYDLDGFLKQKDTTGAIIQIGVGGTAGIAATPSLLETLKVGSSTGTYSIEMGSGTSLTTSGNSNKITFGTSLDITLDDGLYYGVNSVSSGQVLLEVEDLTSGTSSSVKLQPEVVEVSVGDVNLNSVQNLQRQSYYVKINKPSLLYGEIDIIKSESTYDLGSLNKSSLHLNTFNSLTYNGVANSVIIGGTDQVALESNTVYVPQLVIKDGDRIKSGAGYGLLEFNSANDVILATDKPMLSNSVIGIFSSTSSSSHLSGKNGILVRDTHTYSYSPSEPSPVTFISTEFSYVVAGVYNSVIIGGNNLTATSSDTVYLGNKVNINNSYTLPEFDGSALDVLLTDGDGQAYWGTVPSLSTANLSQVLAQGNDSLTSNIIMGTGTSILSGNGGGVIYLDESYTSGNVVISTNGGSISDTYIDMNPSDLNLYSPGTFNINFNSSTIVSGDLEGLKYAFDYSASFTTYSLVSKEYVDSVISSVGATNGLGELSNGVIGLGGTLSQNTTVDGDNYDFSLNGLGKLSFTSSIWIDNRVYPSPDYGGQYFLDGYSFYANSSFGYTGTNSQIYLDYNYLSLESNDGLVGGVSFALYNADQLLDDGSTNNRLIIADKVNYKGLVYDKDYTANFTTYSLVTKGYVDSLSVTPSSGLQYITPGVIGLGGTMSVTSIIEGDNKSFYLNSFARIAMTSSVYNDVRVMDSSEFSKNYLDPSSNESITSTNDGYTFSRFRTTQNESSINASGNNGTVGIVFTSIDQTVSDGSINNNIIVTDGINQKGLVYSSDYTYNFTTYSLVTKGYVDSMVGISPGNGLDFISTGVVGLGGTFSQDVIFNAESYAIRWSNVDRLTVTASTYINNLIDDGSGTKSQLYLEPTQYYTKVFDSIGYISEVSATLNYLSLVSEGPTGSAGINISNIDDSVNDGSTNNRLIVFDDVQQKGLVYKDDYVGQFTTHSLVTKGYVDKQKPYKSYVALLTQTSTNAPTATVLENHFGIGATFSYNVAGNYRLHMAGQFTSSKTVIFVGSADQGVVGGDFAQFIANRIDTDKIDLITIDVNGAGTTDGLLNDTSIEIRVYP